MEWLPKIMLTMEYEATAFLWPFRPKFSQNITNEENIFNEFFELVVNSDSAKNLRSIKSWQEKCKLLL